MTELNLDTKGLRCPQPVLKIAAIMPKMSPGDILNIVGDCPTFEEDVKKWCERMKKTLLSVHQEEGATVIQLLF